MKKVLFFAILVVTGIAAFAQTEKIKTEKIEGVSSKEASDFEFMKKILQLDADRPISTIGIELSKDPSLLTRISVLKSDTSYTFLNLEGGIKLSNGLTNIFSSGSFENPNWFANLNFIFAPKSFLITKFYKPELDSFRTKMGDPKAWMNKEDASQRIYWWFSVKAGYDQANNTIYQPLSEMYGNPNVNITKKRVSTLAFSPSLNFHFFPSKKRTPNLNIFAKLTYTYKPNDNNLDDLDDFTLFKNTTIQDTINHTTYTVSTDQKTGKMGTYKEAHSNSLRFDATFLLGKKQNYVGKKPNYALNLNFLYTNKEFLNTLFGEGGVYLPFRVSGSENDAKYANLGFIVRTKDLLKSSTTSFGKNIIIGLRVGFQL